MPERLRRQARRRARSTTAPRCTSSPRRRIHWPGCGDGVDAHAAVDRASHCSCITTASAPAGTCAPVKMRAAVPGCERRADRCRPAMRWLTRQHRAGARRRRRRAAHSRPSRCCRPAARRARSARPRPARGRSASKVETVSARRPAAGPRRAAAQRLVQRQQRRARQVVGGMVLIALGMAQQEIGDRVGRRSGRTAAGRSARAAASGLSVAIATTNGSFGYCTGLPVAARQTSIFSRSACLKPSTSTQSQSYQLGDQLVHGRLGLRPRTRGSSRAAGPTRSTTSKAPAWRCRHESLPGWSMSKSWCACLTTDTRCPAQLEAADQLLDQRRLAGAGIAAEADDLHQASRR